MDPLKRPKRPAPDPVLPADLSPAVAALMDRLIASNADVAAALRDNARAVGRVESAVKNFKTPAPNVTLHAAEPVVATPDVHVNVGEDVERIVRALPTLPPELLVRALSALPVEVRNKVALDDETVAALKQNIEVVTKGTRAIGGVTGGLGKLPNVVGNWDYAAGVDGTPSIPANARILSITATAGASDGSVTVNGGDTVTIPALSSWIVNPEANLVGPTVVFTGTASYSVDWVA